MVGSINICLRSFPIFLDKESISAAFMLDQSLFNISRATRSARDAASILSSAKQCRNMDTYRSRGIKIPYVLSTTELQYYSILLLKHIVISFHQLLSSTKELTTFGEDKVIVMVQ